MKLVMTLLARDEADVIEANLRYHLESGVDFVIATDNGSTDGTRELLADYERDGAVRVIDQPTQDADYGPWRTRMARMAATDLGADWIINNDADEFWWPEGGDLKAVLEELPADYGMVRAPRANFLARRGDAGFFADRMVARSPDARPRPKTAHRALADIEVGSGNHAFRHPDLRVLGGWYPIHVLHFPVRSYEQWERRVRQTTLAKRAGGLREKQYGEDYRRLERGELRDRYEELAVGDAEIEAGVRDGSVIVDARLREFFDRHGRPPREDLWTPGRAEPLPAPPVPAGGLPTPVLERRERIVGSALQYERQLKLDAERLEQKLARAERRTDKERRRRKKAEDRLKDRASARGGARARLASALRRARAR